MHSIDARIHALREEAWALYRQDNREGAVEVYARNAEVFEEIARERHDALAPSCGGGCPELSSLLYRMIWNEGVRSAEKGMGEVSSYLLDWSQEYLSELHGRKNAQRGWKALVSLVKGKHPRLV